MALLPVLEYTNAYIHEQCKTRLRKSGLFTNWLHFRCRKLECARWFLLVSRDVIRFLNALQEFFKLVFFITTISRWSWTLPVDLYPGRNIRFWHMRKASESDLRTPGSRWCGCYHACFCLNLPTATCGYRRCVIWSYRLLDSWQAPVEARYNCQQAIPEFAAWIPMFQ